MISVSDRSRVAVLAMAELAQRGGSSPVPILEVSECRGIPAHQVEQVFAALRRAAGADRLSEAFREVTVADVAAREARRAEAPMFHI